MTQAIQLLALLTASLLILHKITSRTATQLVALLLTAYLALQIASVYLLGNFVNYQFYTHLNIDDLKPYAFQFIPEIGFLLITGISIWLFLTIASRYVRRTFQAPHIIVQPVLVTLLILLSIPTGILRESYDVYKILSVGSPKFSTALSNVGIDPDHYPLPGEIVAKAGKNIIVISMESLERGFLENSFTGTTPTLRRLSEELTYFSNMPQTIGGEWTAASLYNHQVGMPAFFTGHGNSFFQGAREARLTGLGHVLDRAGYNSVYILGNPEHGGTNDLLGVYNIPIVSQYNSIGKYPETPTGLNDFDLFEEAKLQIAQLSTQEQPFAIFLSTINTHWPDGIYDERMEGKTSQTGSSMAFSVASLDYLIGDFIDFLSDSNLLDDTVLFMFPDHLLMGRDSAVLRELNEHERELFLITNASQKTLSKSTEDPVYKIEIPRIVIDGAEIKSNAKFLSDFITDQSISTFLEKNQLPLTELNLSSLSRASFINEIQIIKDENRLYVFSDDAAVAFQIQPSGGDNVFDVTFNASMNAISQESVEIEQFRADRFFVPNDYDKTYNRIHLTIFVADNHITAYLGNKQSIGITLAGDNSVSFETQDINRVLDSSKNMNKFYLPFSRNIETIEPKSKAKDRSRFIAHAGGAIDGETYTNSLEALNHNYTKGFRLFELDIIQTRDDVFVAAHDWATWKKMSGYNGAIPPSKEDFKSHNLMGKYTSLDMDDINFWFGKHPDAILVTDKVNKPLEFSNLFIDKNRLMMELFSPAAVREGLQAGIRSAMPSWRILSTLSGDKVEQLKSLGITAIAASRRAITHESDTLRAITKAGINIYAFHINADPGKDELYVVCEELDYFYGLYADNWNFDTELICDKP